MAVPEVAVRIRDLDLRMMWNVIGYTIARPLTLLLDDELMYVRLNPRTHTVFGLGKVEVAFD